MCTVVAPTVQTLAVIHTVGPTRFLRSLFGPTPVELPIVRSSFFLRVQDSETFLFNRVTRISRPPVLGVFTNNIGPTIRGTTTSTVYFENCKHRARAHVDENVQLLPRIRRYRRSLVSNEFWRDTVSGEIRSVSYVRVVRR